MADVQDFYQEVANALMEAYKTDPASADEVGLKMVNEKFEDEAERQTAITAISQIVATKFEQETAAMAEEAKREEEEAVAEEAVVDEVVADDAE